MTYNKKLLEAALMIKEHCEHTEEGFLCPFSEDGVCRGDDNCGFNALPWAHWNIKKPCRWTKEDYELAKALSAFGVIKIRKLDGAVSWLHHGRLGEKLPDFAFSRMNEQEIIDLEEIIVEYEESEK